MLELITNQRLRLALKVLDSIYNLGVGCTYSEAKQLRLSYRRGDTAGMILEDIATAVIHEELDRIRTASTEYIEKRPPQTTPPRKPVASESKPCHQFNVRRVPSVRLR